MGHLHNALHHPTQLLDALRRAVGEGDDSDFEGTSRFGETLTPVLDIFTQPEWRLLRGESWWSRYVNTATAPAGRFASVELVNPTGSDILAVVRVVHQASSPDFEVGPDTGGSIAANPVSNSARPLDTRLVNAAGGFADHRCTLTLGDVAAGVTNPNWLYDVIEGTACPEFILRPGSKLWLIATAAATDLQANIAWSERRLFPGEERA